MITDTNLRARLTQYRNGWRDIPVATPTADDIAYARILLADPCSYCGQAAGHIDHANHAEHGWANLTASCKRCNTAKGQHTLIRFLHAKQLRIQRNDLVAQIRALGESNGSRYAA